MVKPSSVHREIDPDHLKRASKVEQMLVGPYLDQIVTSMHIALDGWRYHDQPPDEVELALDAFIALWTIAQQRV